jgi:hypothetical protein
LSRGGSFRSDPSQFSGSAAQATFTQHQERDRALNWGQCYELVFGIFCPFWAKRLAIFLKTNAMINRHFLPIFGDILQKNITINFSAKLAVF